jgi:hypothetical protein
MRFVWQQLSPGEREVLLRHFLLKRKDAPVTAEGVCAAMKETHYLSCRTDASGKARILFITARKGVPTGKSVADDLAEGIFKAALRAKGIEVEDELPPATARRRVTALLERAAK